MLIFSFENDQILFIILIYFFYLRMFFNQRRALAMIAFSQIGKVKSEQEFLKIFVIQQSNINMVSAYRTLLLALVLLLLYFVDSQKTNCDYELILVSSQMGNFNTRGYNPPVLNRTFTELNSLQATILATYQLCFGKIIIDPSSLYPQDKSECLMGLYNVSLLQAQYTGNFDKIKADVDKLAKIVFSTENNCNPILNYRGWDNISDDCKSAIKDIDVTINDYDNDIILGGTGIQYLNSLLLQVEKLRKLCGFNILTKPKHWNNDSCKAANIDWLYPITDQFDTLITNKDYKNFTANFYNLYQSVYRAHDLCITDERVQVQ